MFADQPMLCTDESVYVFDPPRGVLDGRMPIELNGIELIINTDYF
jgi:hypothetical protein